MCKWDTKSDQRSQGLQNCITKICGTLLWLPLKLMILSIKKKKKYKNTIINNKVGLVKCTFPSLLAQTFPHKNLSITSVIKDEAIIGIQSCLGKRILICNQRHWHGTTAIRNLLAKNRTMKFNTSCNITIFNNLCIQGHIQTYQIRQVLVLHSWGRTQQVSMRCGVEQDILVTYLVLNLKCWEGSPCSWVLSVPEGEPKEA